VDRRRQRRDQTDAAVAVPGAVELDRREEDRQRRRGHDVADRDPGTGDASPVRPLPGLDLSARHPDDRLAGAEVGGDEGEALEPPALEGADDPGDAAVRLGAERFGQELPERRGVDQPADPRGERAAARDQAHPPARHVPEQRPRVDPEDPVDVEAPP
jgi:hypothetical protein